MMKGSSSGASTSSSELSQARSRASRGELARPRACASRPRRATWIARGDAERGAHKAQRSSLSPPLFATVPWWRFSSETLHMGAGTSHPVRSSGSAFHRSPVWRRPETLEERLSADGTRIPAEKLVPLLQNGTLTTTSDVMTGVNLINNCAPNRAHQPSTHEF